MHDLCKELEDKWLKALTDWQEAQAAKSRLMPPPATKPLTSESPVPPGWVITADLVKRIDEARKRVEETEEAYLEAGLKLIDCRKKHGFPRDK